MPAVNRSATREAVIQTVFEIDFRGLAAEEREVCLAYSLDGVEDEVGSLDRDFAEKLLDAVFANLDEIKKILISHAPEWPYDKIARLDRVVLLAAIAELKFFTEDVPPSVTLNEYVEIAKNYSDDSSRRFVNGVLSSVKKEMERQE